MTKRPFPVRVIRFFKVIYLKIFRINDTPQKIALGAGVGVFFGVMPASGPLLALFAAFIFRANRAAALLGSLLTNTWLIIPIFLSSIKVGCAIMGLRHEDVYKNWEMFIKDFKLAKLLDPSAYQIMVPIVAGYLVISLAIGLMAYLLMLALLTYRLKKRS